MTFTEYNTQLNAATSLEVIADIVDKLDTDGDLTHAEASGLAYFAVERILSDEVLS